MRLKYVVPKKPLPASEPVEQIVVPKSTSTTPCKQSSPAADSGVESKLPTPKPSPGLLTVTNGVEAQSVQATKALYDSFDLGREQLRPNDIQFDLGDQLQEPSTVVNKIEPIALASDRDFASIKFDNRFSKYDDDGLQSKIAEIIMAIKQDKPVLIQTQTTTDSEAIKEAVEEYLKSNPDIEVSRLLKESSVINPSSSEMVDKHIVFVTNNEVHFAPRIITAPPSTGLTANLALIALERLEHDKPVLILVDSENKQRKVAQALLDFTDPRLRSQILETMQLVNNGSKSIQPNAKIFIANIHAMKKSEIRKAIKLENIQTILVDDAQNCITEKHDRSKGFTLETIIRETNANRAKPLELISSTSTPADFPIQSDSPDAANLFTLHHLSPDFQDHDSKTRISPRTLTLPELTIDAAIKKFYLRNFNAHFADGCFADGSPIATKEEIQTRLEDTTSDGNLCQKIADWYKVNAIKDGKQKKFEIWAVNAKAARAITETLISNGINAAQVVKGKQGLIGLPSFGTGVLKVFADPDKDPTAGEDVEIVEQEILDKYSDPNGEVSVLVHCGELLRGFNSPVTEGVIVADAIDSEAKLQRIIAAATSKDHSKKEPDNRVSDIVCLDSVTCDNLKRAALRNVNDISLKSKPTGLTATAGGGRVVKDGAVSEMNFSTEIFSEGNRTWLLNYLQPVIQLVSPESKTKNQVDIIFKALVSEYVNNSKINIENLDFNELLDITLGRGVNPLVFRDFITWITAQYQAPLELNELIRDIPELTGVQNSTEAFLPVHRIYQQMQSQTNDTWLAVLDKAINNTATEAAQSVENRSRFIADFGYELLGEEYFTSPIRTEHLISVVTGSKSNPLIFAKLIAKLGLDSEEIETTFPDLLVGSPSKFDRLKTIITAEHPDGPPSGMSLEEFFKTELLKLDITYPVLLKSAQLGDTSRSIKAALIGDLGEFLYAKFFIQLISEDFGSGTTIDKLLNKDVLTEGIPKTAKKQLEDMLKAEPLNQVGQELIYIQLAEKLWPNYPANQLVKSKSFEYKLTNNSIEINSLNPHHGSTISPLTLEQADKRWIKKLNNILGGTRIQDGALNYEQRALMGSSIQEFLATKPPQINNLPKRVFSSKTGLELISYGFDNRYLQSVLTGNINSPEEQKLFRAYISWLESQGKGITLEATVTEFPKLTGIETKEEAKRALVSRCPSFSTELETQVKPDELKQAKTECGLTNEILIDRGWITRRTLDFFKVPMAMFFAKHNLEIPAGKFCDDMIKLRGEEIIQSALDESGVIHLMGKQASDCAVLHSRSFIGSKQVQTIFIPANNEIMIQLDALGTGYNYIYKNGMWYEFADDVTSIDDREKAIDMRSASSIPVNGILELRTLFLKLLESSSLKQCDENWLKQLDLNSKDDPLRIFNLAIEFFGEHMDFIKAHDWNLEKAFQIILGHQPSIPKQTGNKPSPEQEFFRNFAQFLQARTQEDAFKIESVIASYPKLTGVKDEKELKLAVSKTYPKLSELLMKHKLAKDEQGSWLNQAFKIVENLLNMDASTMDSILAMPTLDQIQSQLVNVLFDSQHLVETSEFLYQDLKIRKLWDDETPRFNELVKQEPGKMLWVTRNLNFCSIELHVTDAILDAKLLSYDPDSRSFILMEKLSDTGRIIEREFSSNENMDLFTRRVTLTGNCYGVLNVLNRTYNPQPASYVLSNLIAEFVDEKASVNEGVEAVAPSPETVNFKDLISTRPMLQEFLGVLFRLDKQPSQIMQVAARQFIEFAETKHQGFQASFESSLGHFQPLPSIAEIKTKILESYPDRDSTRDLLLDESKAQNFLQSILGHFNISQDTLITLFDITKNKDFFRFLKRNSDNIRSVLSHYENHFSHNFEITDQALEEFLTKLFEKKDKRLILCQILDQIYPPAPGGMLFATVLKNPSGTKEYFLWFKHNQVQFCSRELPGGTRASSHLTFDIKKSLIYDNDQILTPAESR